jgi:hypothetical protein
LGVAELQHCIGNKPPGVSFAALGNASEGTFKETIAGLRRGLLEAQAIADFCQCAHCLIVLDLRMPMARVSSR